MAILLHSAAAGSSVTLLSVRHHHAAATALTFSSWWPLKFNYRSRPRSFNSLLCFASSGDRPPSVQISVTAKIRNEVLSPFRTVRMFLYLAFATSGALGGLIALTRLIAQLKNAAGNSEVVTEIVKGLGIDLAAVAVFAFLYLTEQKAQKAELAKLSREETLAKLKMETRAKKVVSVAELRGVARLVIVAGSASFIQDSFRLSKPFTEALLERGVRVLYFATDGLKPELEGSSSSSSASDSNQKDSEESLKRLKSLWQLTPLYTSEWSKWLNEQKSLANVGESLPIYISLRMDGRVRGSGVGYPPWNAFVAQLPPLKGIWVGVLDGMDGRV